MTKAAILPVTGERVEVHDVDLIPPRADEVQIKLAASGICHTDLSAQQGVLMLPTPVVLGHEGSGVVESVGAGVTNLARGDHVVISWVPQCGQCFYCSRHQPNLCEKADITLASGGLLDGTPRFSWNEQPLYQMAASGTFAESTVVPASGAVKISTDIDLGMAALLGCSVLTGTGAVFRTADVQAGETVAVVGCGGVGLNAIQAARIREAESVIAIDMHADKLELARTLGATDIILANSDNAVSDVMSLTEQRGVDVAIEVVGLPSTIDTALAITRRGGRTILVGVPAMDTMVQIPAFLGLVLAEKTVKGCWYGSSDVQKDIPALIKLYEHGQLLLEPLITRTIQLEEVNEALDALRDGRGTRTLIRY